MNKYCVSGFKFQTEEVSRNKKTNNSGVYIQGDVDGTGQTIEYYGVIYEIIEVRLNRLKKKSRRPIDHEDIAGAISSAPERISHDTHIFVVLFSIADPRQYYPNYRRPVGDSFTSHALPPRCYEDLPLQAIRRARPLSAGTPSPTGTYPQLSAMRIGDSSSEQSYAMAGTPPLTQHFMHPNASPLSTARPSATPNDEMPALAPCQKDRLGRVMIEPDGSLWHPTKDVARALKDCVRRLYT
ncbi:hypothetical protein H5410_055659 [Solanum commersonii]|uniref:Uncharacterized protein n=1 Tax=Solanum commersonii TaxID=4109 RepID=A0A9J5WJC7_SOLCO|nr:hypothetical protein H5410_055659 [Solanum commersonii]